MKTSFFSWLKNNIWLNVFWLLFLIVILYFVSGEMKYRYHKQHLEQLSPTQILNLYFKAQWKEDEELLRKIIHSCNNYTGKRTQSNLEKNDEGVQRSLMILLAIKQRAVHQRPIEPNSVEVGYVSYSMYKPFIKNPVGMHVMFQEDRIWKIYSNKWKWGEMLEYLSQNPDDLSSYYLCSNDMANQQDFLMDYRFRKKYYELDPEGFWVTRSFLERLKVDEENYEINYKSYERQLLTEMAAYSELWKVRKARNFITLARIFMFHQDFQKAETYLNNAEDVLKQEKGERKYMKEAFDRAWDELRLRQEGKYVDPIEELDRLRLIKAAN